MSYPLMELRGYRSSNNNIMLYYENDTVINPIGRNMHLHMIKIGRDISTCYLMLDEAWGKKQGVEK